MGDPVIVDLSPAHADLAARLHIAGQPGTFLTSLGPDVLAVLYRGLPVSSTGFGYAAVVGEAQDNLLGFVSATTGVGRLFVELGVTRIGQFLPPLLARFVRHPSLIWRGGQTVLYPWLVRDDGEAHQHGVAELLSIMVEPAARRRGIGAQLVDRLCDECGRRRIGWLDVTVEANNGGARRFYGRHGFELRRQFKLYGRLMCLYRRRITGE